MFAVMPADARFPRAGVATLADARAGEAVPLDPADARHLAGPRRLGEGALVELFDPAGRTAPAALAGGARARLTADPSPPASRPRLVVVAAVPKGARADWLAEKLAELAVTIWVPLVADRSAVDPGGGRLARWRRLAHEAAKQSGAPPMAVADPARSADLDPAGATVLSTERDARPLAPAGDLTLWVGPEGGWSPAELARFDAAGAAFAALGPTVLRVETAAVVAAGVARVVG